jgi:hypothetical protein
LVSRVASADLMSADGKPTWRMSCRGACHIYLLAARMCHQWPRIIICVFICCIAHICRCMA